MNNRVTLTGKALRVPQFSHEAYYEKYYRFILGIVRTSGASDEIPVLVSDHIIDINDILDGKRFCISGGFRSYNEHTDEKAHLILDVFATDICEVADEDENHIELRGCVCKKPVHRVTPSGREITELLLAVNRINGKTDYIPMIAWGRISKCAQRLEVGDYIYAIGRIQSRNYLKNDVTKTAYEVSISQLIKEEQYGIE